MTPSEPVSDNHHYVKSEGGGFGGWSTGFGRLRLRVYNLGWERFEWRQWAAHLAWRDSWTVSFRLSVGLRPFLAGVLAFTDEEGERHYQIGVGAALLEMVLPAPRHRRPRHD